MDSQYCISFFPSFQHHRGYAIFTGSVFLLLLLLMSACGPTQGATGLPAQGHARQGNAALATFDPCVLFAKDDASRLLGATVRVLPDLAAPLCTYTVASAADTKGNTISSFTRSSEIVTAVGTADNVRGYFERDRAQARAAATTQDVSGIGDEAFTIKFAAGGAIVVLRKDTVFSITVLAPFLQTTAVQDGLRKLARIATGVISNGTPSLAVPNPSPCTLMTAQEASQALHGTSVQWLYTANDAGVASCDYIASTQQGGRVQLVVNSGESGARNLYQSQQSGLSKKKMLNGIGDAAFYDERNTIWVLKGKTFFHVTILGPAVSEALIKGVVVRALARF